MIGERLGIATKKPVVPAEIYAKRNGTTGRLRAMQAGDFLDFDPADTNRVRVMAQRVDGLFVSRTLWVDGSRILRVWRLQ